MNLSLIFDPTPFADKINDRLGGFPDLVDDAADDGWLLIYHGVSRYDVKYRLGAALLDLNNPSHVIARLNHPILEPDAWYENKGYREGTVFACGSAIIEGQLFVYYGGADQYVGVASTPLKKILDALKSG